MTRQSTKITSGIADLKARLAKVAGDRDELRDALKEVYTPFCNLVDLANRFSPEGVSAEEYRRFMGMVQRMNDAIRRAEPQKEKEKA